MIAYYQLATDSPWASVTADSTEQLAWTLPDGSIREATIDRIIFVRPS